MNLTVIICTYQRHESLVRAIVSLLPEFTDASGDSILVVDNSTDGASAEELSSKYSDKSFLRFIHEPTPGLSHARNKGLIQSDSDIVAYVDDDVFVDRGWLNAMKTAFSFDEVTVSAVGGRVRLALSNERPKWLHDGMLGYLGQWDLGDEMRMIQPSELFVGCNMAFRRQILTEVGGFPVSLGRHGNGVSLLSNEELAVSETLRKEGHVFRYAPQASLTHVVDGSRLTKDWFRRRFAWQAVSDAVSGGARLQGKQAKAKIRQPILTASHVFSGTRQKLFPGQKNALEFYLELEGIYDRTLKLLTAGI